MAKKSAAKGRAGNPLPAASQSDDGAHGVTRPTKPAKPSSLLDTRVVYCGDNLEQLAKLPDACVDLIYIDPPFNSNRNYGPCRTGQCWGLPREITSRATRPRCLRRISRGSPCEITSHTTTAHRLRRISRGETKEKRAFEDRHEKTKAYIDYMRPRCVQLARVLKKTGSFYYHCDWHAGHYVKVMLDQIFGNCKCNYA
jgi:site-specific DNA-methyltransferase (adenine-specific)